MEKEERDRLRYRIKSLVDTIMRLRKKSQHLKYEILIMEEVLEDTRSKLEEKA